MEDVEVHVIEYRLCPAIEDIDNLDSDYDNLIYSCPPSKQQRLVPIIQVFGRTKSNQTACVHVHNCYPTLYIGVPRNANLVECIFLNYK